MSITFEIVIGEKKIQAKGKNIPRREKYESRKQKRYLGAKKKDAYHMDSIFWRYFIVFNFSVCLLR